MAAGVRQCPLSGVKRTKVQAGRYVRFSSLIGHLGSSAFRLSTTPVSMSAHGLSLLFGLLSSAIWGQALSGYPPLRCRCRLTGSRFSSDSALRPFHHGDSKTRWNNLLGGLAVSVTAGPSGQTISPHHRPARDIIPPLGGARFPPIAFDPAQISSRCGFWAASPSV